MAAHPQGLGRPDVVRPVVDEQDALGRQAERRTAPRVRAGLRLGVADAAGEGQDREVLQPLLALLVMRRQFLRDVRQQAEGGAALRESRDKFHHLVVDAAPARHIGGDEFRDAFLVEMRSERPGDRPPITRTVLVTPVVRLPQSPVALPERGPRPSGRLLQPGAVGGGLLPGEHAEHVEEHRGHDITSPEAGTVLTQRACEYTLGVVGCQQPLPRPARKPNGRKGTNSQRTC